MKYLFVLLVPLMLVHGRISDHPVIGEPVSRYYDGPLPSGSMIMTSPSSVMSSADVVVDGIRYRLGFNQPIHGVDPEEPITYVETKDRQFVTPEGIHIRSTMAEAIAASEKEHFMARGWATIVVLPSGWKAAFYDAKNKTAEVTADSARVSWLFRDRTSAKRR